MSPLSIPRQLSGQIEQDFFRLRDEALNWLAQWCAAPTVSGLADAAGREWSDFNVHDPGVQIMEVVCYALTELAYRARLPMTLILQDERGQIHWEDGAMFAPPDILPMNPLTAADYQKLLLDRFYQIQQVRLTASKNGHHSVSLVFQAIPEAERKQVLQGAQVLLDQQRNLAERFTVEAESDVDHQAIPAQPTFVSLAARQQMGQSLSQILTGPLLQHGTLPDESIKPLLEGTLAEAQQLADHYHSIGYPPSPPSTKLLRHPGWKMPMPAPSWPRKDLPEFHPLQQSFPPNYAVGLDELPDGATPLRRAQVQQLRGYLLHFEQLMRNFLEQLVHLPSLFSVKPQQQTYFSQTLYAVPDVMPLLKGFNAEGLHLSRAEIRSLEADYRQNLANPYRRQLSELGESPLEFRRRRHRFLDHLLARFGESYGPPQGATYETAQNKESLLQQLPELGRRRATAAETGGGTAGRACLSSGLEAKIRCLLQRDSTGASRRPQTLPFYYVVENGLLSSPGDADDAFELSHVLVNWTVNQLNSDFKQSVESLIEEHSGAHLGHTFYWLDPQLSPKDKARARGFRKYYKAWQLSPLKPDSKAAADLKSWLQDQKSLSMPSQPQ
jgi:hypothetical protein